MKTQAGSRWDLLDEVAARIERSAALRDRPVVEHADEMLRGFVARVKSWRDAKRPAPSLNVSAFAEDKHFVACEEWADGERPTVETPTAGNGRSSYIGTAPAADFSQQTRIARE